MMLVSLILQYFGNRWGNICSKKYKTVCQRIWEFLNCLLWCLSGFSYNRISVTLFNDDKESRHMNCHMNFHPIIFKSAIMFDCLMTIVHLEYQQDRNGPSNITTQHTTQLQTSPHPQRQLHLLDITAGQILSVTLSPHHPMERVFRNLISNKSFNH